jgi:CubicO group peptidase (beta-lactamase class C family)
MILPNELRPTPHHQAMTLLDDLQVIAEASDFSGVVTVSRHAQRVAELSRGFADRANKRPITLDTRFGIASVAKGLTALTVASLIESGELRSDTTLRSLLPNHLPMVDPAVTIKQLLGHTSGVGDYLDEDELGDVDDYVMGLPVHQLAAPSDYLPLLDGHTQRTEPGTHFAYNNGGYVMLSIAVEVATGRSFYDLVQERVLDPAGMTDTAFERTDRLPAAAAIGYLADGRSNVLHLPVRGAGDGGAYSTVRDLEGLWQTLFAGRIVPISVVDGMVAPRSDAPGRERRRYGLGFWLRADRESVMLEGSDAGVSCRTVHDRPSSLTYTVVSNTSSGAWPLVRYLEEQLPSLAAESAI